MLCPSCGISRKIPHFTEAFLCMQQWLCCKLKLRSRNDSIDMECSVNGHWVASCCTLHFQLYLATDMLAGTVLISKVTICRHCVYWRLYQLVSCPNLYFTDKDRAYIGKHVSIRFHPSFDKDFIDLSFLLLIHDSFNWKLWDLYKDSRSRAWINKVITKGVTIAIAALSATMGPRGWRTMILFCRE